jgi:hypothetical protein
MSKGRTGREARYLRIARGRQISSPQGSLGGRRQSKVFPKRPFDPVDGPKVPSSLFTDRNHVGLGPRRLAWGFVEAVD